MTFSRNRLLFAAATATLFFARLGNAETREVQSLDGTSIGFEWFSPDHKMHYSGPGESWWGADLAILPIDKGRVVVSQLRIVENLGRDPVADKLLRNLLKFATDR